MSKGGVSSTVADAKIILATALKVVASSIIVSHNHPSGALKPSDSDVELTNRLKEGARLLDISVLDHLVVTPQFGKYFSFADEGMIG
jgi:DNA repair protein RadC